MHVPRCTYLTVHTLEVCVLTGDQSMGSFKRLATKFTLFFPPRQMFVKVILLQGVILTMLTLDTDMLFNRNR